MHMNIIIASLTFTVFVDDDGCGESEHPILIPGSANTMR